MLNIREDPSQSSQVVWILGLHFYQTRNKWISQTFRYIERDDVQHHVYVWCLRTNYKKRSLLITRIGKNNSKLLKDKLQNNCQQERGLGEAIISLGGTNSLRYWGAKRSPVMPCGTATPILLKWFVSRDVPTGAPCLLGLSELPFTFLPAFFFFSFFLTKIDSYVVCLYVFPLIQPTEIILHILLSKFFYLVQTTPRITRPT